MKPLPRLADDELPTPEVGAWAENKYDTIRYYATLFSSSMKARWDCRVYVDLFAGAGRARLKGTRSILPSSATIALSVGKPFDAYLFCERDKQLIGALEARVKREFRPATVEYIRGDVNAKIDRVLAAIPPHRSDFKVLTFCLADPCKVKDLRFATIEAIATRFVDFLVLVPTYMDAGRNLGAYYTDPQNPTLDDFLGNRSWRDAWASAPPKTDPAIFVADQFGQQMRRLDYIYDGPESGVLNRSTDQNLPLYHLMLFSRHPLGAEFFKETRRYVDPQRDLEW